MLGLMQRWSMTLDRIIVHAGEACATRPVISRESDSGLRIADYRTVLETARRFSAALAAYGISLGDRVATLMWNDFDHLAAWYGTMGIGAVLHTLNPRLHPDQIAWIARHGGARVLVIEDEFRDLVGSLLDRVPSVELVVVSGTGSSPGAIGRVETVGFADFAGEARSVRWGDFDEETAAGLCYTSGTTGDPKGVLYSHRSNFLHALAVNQPNGLAIGADDVVMPVVPMFHANAWALAFVAPMAGAELVLPGRRLDGASLRQLMEEREVTVAVGVPTVWQDLLVELRRTGGRLPALRRIVVGGSAVSSEIVQEFAERHGVDVVHAWGMTEMSPLGTITSATPATRGQPTGTRLSRKLRQGGALFPVEVGIFDDEGRPCPRDDRSAGALRVRGPSVARHYFGSDAPILDKDGWFDTGDIAVVDQMGSVRLVDRAKDVIKSGGEWISSIELENLAVAHPDVRRAAVVAVVDEKWGERPLLVVEADPDRTPTPAQLIEHLRPSVPRWWLPTHFAYCDIPLGATGKIDKLSLRRLLGSDDAPKVTINAPDAT